MSTPSLTRRKPPLSDEQAQKIIEQVASDLPLHDWQKVVLRGVLTGNSPVIISNRRGPNLIIRQALDRIEEARSHGLA